MKTSSFFLLMLSIIFSFTSTSWIFTWFMMEMNMVSFIFLINQNNLKSLNSTMKYFIIQASASSLILLSILLFKVQSSSYFSSMTMFIALWLKLGMYPFSNWYLQVNENLNYNAFFIMNMFQKMIPFYVMSINLNIICFKPFIIMSIFFSTMDMINQTSIRWILSCSSINHFSWMCTSLLNYNSMWQLYMIMYIFMLLMMYPFMKSINPNSLYCLFNNKSMMNNVYMSLTLMSFAGIPPLMGFLPKMLIIINNEYKIFMLILLFCSLINSFIYVRFILPILFKNYIFQKNNWNKFKSNTYLTTFFNMMSLFMLGPLFLY